MEIETLWEGGARTWQRQGQSPFIIVVGYLDAHLRPEHSPIRPDQRYRQKHTVIVSLVAYMSISNNSNYDIRTDVLRKANQFIDYWASV